MEEKVLWNIEVNRETGRKKESRRRRKAKRTQKCQYE